MTFTRASRALLAAGLAGCLVQAPVAAQDAAKPPVAPTEAARHPSGEALYAASFKDLKDQAASLGAYKGQVTVVYFWATWCVPCRLETPKLVKLYAAYKAKGVAVVGIALDNGDKVRTFVKDNGVTYPIVYGNAVRLGRELGNTDGAIPFMVVIDKAGRVVETFRGDLPDGKLEAVLDPLVG